jgi:hypothetical protein
MLQIAPPFHEFIGLGIAHIGALASEWVGPEGLHFPDGIDHILFIVALVLSGGGLWKTLKSTMGFTVGHSIALALSASGAVHLPSRWVESAIALSIAYLASEDLVRKDFKHRWQIAALFGIVHGFGFATALDSLSLTGWEKARAWLGFSLGVEIGQVIIVAFLVPLVAVLKKEPVLDKYAVSSCSLVVFLIGSYWFVVRALSA